MDYCNQVINQFKFAKNNAEETANKRNLCNFFVVLLVKQLINEKTVARNEKKTSMQVRVIYRKFGEKEPVKPSITLIIPPMKFTNIANRIKTRVVICILIELKRYLYCINSA